MSAPSGRNITYFNQVITSTTSTNNAEITKTYNGYFRKKSDNSIYIVVDKFNVDLSSIPLMIFNTAPNAYTVELSNGALSSGRISLMTGFYSTNTDLTPNNPEFYYIYTFDQMIQIINNALTTAYNALNALGGVPAGNASPFFHVDHSSHTLSLYATPSFIEGAVPQVNIWGNIGFAYTLCEGLPFFSVNSNLSTPSPTGRDVRFEVRNKLPDQVTYGGQLYHMMRSNAQADTLIKWNVCKGIVITTGLRIKKEPFPKESITTTNGIVNNSLSTTDILSNFNILYGSNCRPLSVNYVAHSFDKRISLYDEDDINQISLKFFWYDKFNNLYPLTLVNEDTCSVRIAFTE